MSGPPCPPFFQDGVQSIDRDPLGHLPRRSVDVQWGEERRQAGYPVPSNIALLRGSVHIALKDAQRLVYVLFDSKWVNACD